MYCMDTTRGALTQCVVFSGYWSMYTGYPWYACGRAEASIGATRACIRQQRSGRCVHTHTHTHTHTYSACLSSSPIQTPTYAGYVAAPHACASVRPCVCARVCLCQPSQPSCCMLWGTHVSMYQPMCVHVCVRVNNNVCDVCAEIPPNATLTVDVELLSIKTSALGYRTKLVEG